MQNNPGWHDVMTVTAVIPAPFLRVDCDAVASTQQEARRLATDGAPGWTLVTARKQTGGRGRFDRPWVSPEGNLYATLILRPAAGEPPAGTSPALVNLATGLALIDGLSRVAPAAHLHLKWPNDILAGGAKLAGILTEAIPARNGAPVLLIGFGVNLNHHPVDLPYPATNLALAAGETGRVEPEQALTAILPGLHDRLTTFLRLGFESLRPAYLAKLGHVGERVRVHLDAARTQAVEGVLRGIGPDGGLEIDTATGLRRIQAGDVMPLDPTSPPGTG